MQVGWELLGGEQELNLIHLLIPWQDSRCAIYVPGVINTETIPSPESLVQTQKTEASKQQLPLVT